MNYIIIYLKVSIIFVQISLFEIFGFTSLLLSTTLIGISGSKLSPSPPVFLVSFGCFLFGCMISPSNPTIGSIIYPGTCVS